MVLLKLDSFSTSGVASVLNKVKYGIKHPINRIVYSRTA